MHGTSGDDAAPTPWLIDATELTVTAGRRTVIDGMNLRLTTGIHGLLGPNGAGKTTLTRALATVHRPRRGRLEMLGHPVATSEGLRAIRRGIGYLPQQFGYYRNFTVREFVGYVAWLKEVPKPDRVDAVQHAIDRVELSEQADHRLRTLSGGMVRRVGLAQAIVNDPRIVLFDEPTAGLDPEQRFQFREILRSLSRDTCVVVSTHLVEDIAAVCTDVIVLLGGKPVFQGTARELESAQRSEDAAGDSAAERGYLAVLERARVRREAS
jgi:ABC-2 type transport system ATP-binding protein